MLHCFFISRLAYKCRGGQVICLPGQDKIKSGWDHFHFGTPESNPPLLQLFALPPFPVWHSTIWPLDVSQHIISHALKDTWHAKWNAPMALWTRNDQRGCYRLFSIHPLDEYGPGCMHCIGQAWRKLWLNGAVLSPREGIVARDKDISLWSG